MEHQAGPGWAGPAGETTARDGDSNGRERALADAADRTGRAEAEADQSSGSDHGSTSDHGSSHADEPHGTLPIQPEPQPGPESPTTGEPRVDAALKLLDRLPGLPVSDHPELFEQVHAQLSEVLGDLDSGAGTVGPATG